MRYLYSNKDLISDPQTYTYTPYHGLPFLTAWARARRDIISRHTESCPPAAKEIHDDDNLDSSDVINTSNLLENLFLLFSRDFDINDPRLEQSHRFLKTFELTKRVYTLYDENFKPLPSAQFDHLDLYLRAAEVFEAAYTKLRKLYFLNGLLKIMDTLCALHKNLLDQDFQRLSWLVNQEARHISILAERKGIDLNNG